jgi:hypothetical protein
MSKAPWTPEQVAALNRFQQGRWMHPFTCGSSRRTDADHKDGEGLLVATEKGWICPFCDYTQDWAHEFMFQPCPWSGCIACMIAEAAKPSIEST